MLPVRFDDIDSKDILRLVENKISEHKSLDYKEKLTVAQEKDKVEFLADVVSFANASGGDIIFGISDERDSAGKATGLPGKIVSIKLENQGTTLLQLAQIIESGVTPRISGIQIKAIEIPEQDSVILIRVPKSWFAPHAVSLNKRTKFYSRNGSGKLLLDVQQIGAAFAEQRSLGERLRLWKADRIGKAIAEEGPLPLNGAKLLFHFISSASLASGEFWVPRKFDVQAIASKRELLYNRSSGLAKYNADGLLISRSYQMPHLAHSYLQIFRDGSLEYGDNVIFDSHNNHVPSLLFEHHTIKTFGTALSLLNDLEVPEPIFASLTLVGIKGRTMALPTSHQTQFGRYTTDPFDRDVILGPDIRIEHSSEEFPYPTTLFPLINAIWQGAGLEESPYIDGNHWKPSAM